MDKEPVSMEAKPIPRDFTKVGGRYANYVLVVLVFVYVFNFVDRHFLSILAEEIKADLGLTDASIGFLYGTAFAVFERRGRCFLFNYRLNPKGLFRRIKH